jgi:D-methionine transport system substrate-binding protein
MRIPRFIDRPLALLATTALAIAACGGASVGAPGGEDRTITLIASDSGFQPEIVALLKEEVAKQGWELKHMVINDIVQPNQLVEDKQADANFFQHEAFMTQFNLDHNLHVVPAFYTTFAPSGFFSRKYKAFKDIPDGALFGIPADPANNGRALYILRDAGLLKMKDGVPVTKASQRDIVDNPHRFRFIEVDQLMLQRTVEDVDAGYLFPSSALLAGFNVKKDALGLESAENSPYRGIIGTRPELKGGPKMTVLQKAFQNDRVKEFYTRKYGDAVIFLW